MNKSWFTLIGFILLFIGILSIIISIIGANFTFLSWIESFGRLPSFLIKIFFIVAGMLMIIVSLSNLKEENDSYVD